MFSWLCAYNSEHDVIRRGRIRRIIRMRYGVEIPDNGLPYKVWL